MGHLMRTIALGAEAIAQGWGVTIAGDIDDVARNRVHDLIPQASTVCIPRGEQSTRLVELLTSFVPRVVHVDSYWPESEALAAAAPYLSNMQDGPFGVRRATLAIDANLGAENWFESSRLSNHHLAGSNMALIRPQVLHHRGKTREPGGRRVLVVLGGTDPHGITPRVVRALGGLDAALAITVIAPEFVSAQVHEAAASSARITVLPFVDDLPALAVEHDLVITASGTSVWDFACMGIPMGLVCVAENQRLGYRAVIEAGIALPLGEPPHRDLSELLGDVDRLLSDPEGMTALAEHGRSIVDGLGAWRVVSAWSESSEIDLNPPVLTARPANDADARLLFDWRNDPTTRAVSRSTDRLSWGAHVAWLSQVLVDPARQLLVVEDTTGPVGTVRWDHLSGIDWEVSITVAPTHRGQGLGRAVLRAGENLVSSSLPRRLIATVHVENLTSLRLFKNAGYLPHKPADTSGFMQFARLLLLDSDGSAPTSRLAG